MESKRLEILNGFYGEIDEESRLLRSRHGQLEFATTMHYIHKYQYTLVPGTVNT